MDKSEKVKKWRRITKQRMVDSLGGKCCICGYNKCLASLDFHHLDSNEKEISLSSVRGNPKSWNKIVVELRKCICVCSNCHGEIHYGDTKIPEDVVKFDEKYATYYENKRDKLFDKCPICGKKKRKYLKTCSPICSSKKSRKVDWDKVDLLKLKETMSNVEIGKMFNISEAAIRKRLKLINLL